MSLSPPSLLLLLLFSTIPLHGPLLSCVGARKLCPLHCTCYELADLVDCRDQGLAHVPRGLPHGTWLLELGGNNLTVISSRAFAGLWSLRVLVLTGSNIRDIQPQVTARGFSAGI